MSHPNASTQNRELHSLHTNPNLSLIKLRLYMVYSHVLYNCVGGEFLFTAFQLPFPLAFHLNIQIYPPFPNNNPVDQSYHLIHMVLEYFVWHKMTI